MESSACVDAAGRAGWFGRLVCCMYGLLTWRRPLYSAALFLTINVAFWVVALSSWRLYYLLALCLVMLVTVQMVKDMVLSRKRGANLWRSMTESWEVIDSGPDDAMGTSQLTDSWFTCKMFLEEMSSFKQQNPGKFCLLVCSICTFLAILGRYIPGVIISYVVVLAIFLWPLFSSHETGQWLKPVLQKLDFGLANFFQRVRENHVKRTLQKKEETSEADFSALFPKLDSTICKELSISDTEASEVTWTDNGTFNLSEEHTPQTENSEDLDRRSDVDDVFGSAVPEFPSLDNGTGTNGDEEDLSIGLPTPSPRPGGHIEGTAMRLVSQMAGDVITAAVTQALREQLEVAVRQKATLDFAEDSDSDAEDFELLDQSELEQLEGELGLEKSKAKADKSSGLLSTLLRRH